MRTFAAELNAKHSSSTDRGWYTLNGRSSTFLVAALMDVELLYRSFVAKGCTEYQ